MEYRFMPHGLIGNYALTCEEETLIEKTCKETVDLLKSKNLTYLEASEVLRISKIMLDGECKLISEPEKFVPYTSKGIIVEEPGALASAGP